MRTTYLPDSVWRQLDPDAGKLTPRSVLHLWIAIVVSTALLVAGVALWHAGLVVPRLTWTLQEWQETEWGARVRVDLYNQGSWPVTVRGLGRSGPGMELVEVRGELHTDEPNPFPARLEPGRSVSATLVYRITDCHAYPRGEWPVTAVVDRPWGPMTVDVDAGDHALPWAESVASTWCSPYGPGGD